MKLKSLLLLLLFYVPLNAQLIYLDTGTQEINPYNAETEFHKGCVDYISKLYALVFDSFQEDNIYFIVRQNPYHSFNLNEAINDPLAILQVNVVYDVFQYTNEELVKIFSIYNNDEPQFKYSLKPKNDGKLQSVFDNGDQILELTFLPDSLTGNGSPYKFSINGGITFHDNPTFEIENEDEYISTIIRDRKGCLSEFQLINTQERVFNVEAGCIENGKVTFKLDIDMDGKSGYYYLNGIKQAFNTNEFEINNIFQTQEIEFHVRSKNNITAEYEAYKGIVKVYAPPELNIQKKYFISPEMEKPTTLFEASGGKPYYHLTINGEKSGIFNFGICRTLPSGNYNITLYDQNWCKTEQLLEVE